MSGCFSYVIGLVVCIFCNILSYALLASVMVLGHGYDIQMIYIYFKNA